MPSLPNILSQEHQLLVRNRFRNNFTLLCFGAFVIVSLILLLLLTDFDLHRFNRGQIFIAIPIAGIWIFLGLRHIQTVINLWRDLKLGVVETVEGYVQRVDKRGFGLIAPTRKALEVASLTLYSGTADRPVSGQYVSATYAPKSRTFLAHTPLPRKILSFPNTLTEQERALLRCLSEGLSDKLIARALDLSPTTVRTYNSRLFQKLGATNRSDAVTIARRTGYLDVD